MNLRLSVLASGALVALIACGSSAATTTTPGKDSGAPHDALSPHDSSPRDAVSTLDASDAGSAHDTGGDAPKGPPPGPVYTTTCSPDVDVSKGTAVTATSAVVYPGCYVGTAPSGVTIVDSSAAFSASFLPDGGVNCSELSALADVDYTTSSVAIFAAPGFAQATLKVYQVGTGTVFDVSVAAFGAMSIPAIYAVALPTADTSSTEVMVCTTTCSGSGCPA